MHCVNFLEFLALVLVSVSVAAALSGLYEFGLPRWARWLLFALGLIGVGCGVWAWVIA